MTDDNPHDENESNRNDQQQEPEPFATPETAGELDGDQPAVGERPDIEAQKERLRKHREQESEYDPGERDLSDTGTGDPSVDSVEQTMNRLHSQGHAVIHESQEEAAEAAIGRMDEQAPAGTHDAPEAHQGRENAESGASSSSAEDTTHPTGGRREDTHDATRRRERPENDGGEPPGASAAAGSAQITANQQAETVEPATEQSGGSDSASENPRQRNPQTYAERAESEGVDDTSDRSDGDDGDDDPERPDYETRTADELSVEELADPNEEWTLGKEQEALVIQYEGMLVRFDEPDHEDEIINAIRSMDDEEQDDPHSRQRAIAQVVISFPELSNPELTDKRWEHGLTPAQRLQLGNIASGYLNAADFTVESGDMPNPRPD